MSMINNLLIITVIVSLAVIAAAIFIVAYLARKLTTPIVSMTELMKESSEGDFSIKADVSSQNEVGRMGEMEDKSGNWKTSDIEDTVSNIEQAAR